MSNNNLIKRRIEKAENEIASETTVVISTLADFVKHVAERKRLQQANITPAANKQAVIYSPRMEKLLIDFLTHANRGLKDDIYIYHP